MRRGARECVTRARGGWRRRVPGGMLSTGQPEHNAMHRIRLLPRYVRVSGDITYIFGQTDAGRALIVVLTNAIDGRDFVVTARDMTDTERRLYDRRGR